VTALAPTPLPRYGVLMNLTDTTTSRTSRRLRDAARADYWDAADADRYGDPALASALRRTARRNARRAR
jgi:hypothetical protein